MRNPGVHYQPGGTPTTDARKVHHRLVDDQQRPRLLLRERKMREPDCRSWPALVDEETYGVGAPASRDGSLRKSATESG